MKITLSFFLNPLYCIGFIFIYSCTNTERAAHETVESITESVNINVRNDSMIRQARQLIETGDLILRTGIDFSSDQVKEMSKIDKTYSHGGIAVVENAGIYVYHIEPDYANINNKVRKEALDSFCNPAKNYGFGFARYHLTADEKIKFINYLDQQYINRIPFDMDFDLRSDNKLYCSEMIKKGLAKATNNKILIIPERLDDSSKFKLIKQYFKLEEKNFVNREIITLDRLFLNPGCTMIHRYVFEK